MISEKKFINLIKEEYKRKLLEALKEVDVLDDHGNILISRDLKVKHKKSGYEYTVDDIIKQGDDVKVVLRSPESPRFHPPPGEEILGEQPLEVPAGSNSFSGDVKIKDSGNQEEEIIFVVNRKDFEKNYEVE